MGKRVVGREGWREYWAGRDGGGSGQEGWGRELAGGVGEGMVGSDGGEGAYRIQDKMTTTTLLSSSSSFVSLLRALATLLTVTSSCSSVESFVAVGPWARRSLSSVGIGYVVVRGRWSFNSRCWWFSWLLGVRCRSLGAGRCLPLAVFFACGCRLGGRRRLGGRVCLWWGLRDVAAGDVEGARVVVDAGDVGVWLSCFVGGRLSWSVGQGCSS